MYILFSSLMIYFSSQQEKNQVCDLINLYLGRPTSMICETDVVKRPILLPHSWTIFLCLMFKHMRKQGQIPKILKSLTTYQFIRNDSAFFCTLRNHEEKTLIKKVQCSSYRDGFFLILPPVFLDWEKFKKLVQS